MSGLATKREDERQRAGSPLPGECGVQGWRVGRVARGGTRGRMRGTELQPHTGPAPAPRAAESCGGRSPVTTAVPPPARALAERRGSNPRTAAASPHRLGCAGHATLPTINGSLCNKQEESCFANAAELSLHNTAAKHLSAGLNESGSVSGADGSRERAEARQPAGSPSPPLLLRWGLRGGNFTISNRQRVNVSGVGAACCVCLAEPWGAEAAGEGRRRRMRRVRAGGGG